jgi:ComF family protein
MEIRYYLNNLFYPYRCILCGNIIIDKYAGYPVCSNCESILTPQKDILCLICSSVLLSEENKCLRCRDRDLNYISNRSLFKYSGLIKEIIYQYKFNNRKDISLYFAKVFSKILVESYKDCVIVPVPGRKIVKKNKSWEHIDLIGHILKNKYKLPVEILLNRKGKKPQKSLSRDKRGENLRKSISIGKKNTYLPKSLVLLDDVFTTGTTINECAGILKAAGVKYIYSLTIAID